MNEVKEVAEVAGTLGAGGWIGLAIFAGLIIWRVRESKKNTGTYTGGIFGGGGGSGPRPKIK